MKHPVVLDACTIINLLRIDEDEFLFRLLCSLRLYVADLVNQEIMKNIFHNELSEEQRTYISDVLPQLQSKWNSFNQTMDLIDTDFYEENIKKFTRHTKKINGELQSSILSLYLSRKYHSRVFFYTDDFPAKEQFKNFFEFQQIGSIGDSVDLLIFLYWNSPDFSDMKLEKFLHDLFAEYNLSVSNFIKGIDEISESYIKKKNVYKLLREIVDSFYQNEDWLGKVEEVKKKVSSDAKLKALFVSCPEERNCKLVDKIKEVQKMMRDFSIYKKDKRLSMN